jgi:hypothetical protein
VNKIKVFDREANSVVEFKELVELIDDQGVVVEWEAVKKNLRGDKRSMVNDGPKWIFGVADSSHH